MRNDKTVPLIQEFSPSMVSPGTVQNFWVHLVDDTFSNPMTLPLMVAKGSKPGPVLGLTAAVHGNELNGISVIHRLFKEIDPADLAGTIVAVPVVNVPSYIRRKRRFLDGKDLNHIMPGKKNGNVSEVYAYRFFQKIITQLDYLLDLHTASFGRINSYYIRADMDQEETQKLAFLQNADIIVHNPPSDGTLRGAAAEIGIPAITLEVGNPNIFQKKMIKSGVEGIHNALSFLNMINEPITVAEVEPILCNHSSWVYTDTGGLLDLMVDIRDLVKEGDQIAIVKNIFGEKLKTYTAPFSGVVIGKSINPVNQTGGRILHLGKLD